MIGRQSAHSTRQSLFAGLAGWQPTAGVIPAGFVQYRQLRLSQVRMNTMAKSETIAMILQKICTA
jgi:hypothetical protein